MPVFVKAILPAVDPSLMTPVKAPVPLMTFVVRVDTGVLLLTTYPAPSMPPTVALKPFISRVPERAREPEPVPAPRAELLPKVRVPAEMTVVPV